MLLLSAGRPPSAVASPPVPPPTPVPDTGLLFKHHHTARLFARRSNDGDKCPEAGRIREAGPQLATEIPVSGSVPNVEGSKPQRAPFSPAQRYASAGLCDSDVSVCLSVTRRYCD